MDVREEYLRLLRGCLTRSMFEDGAYPVAPPRNRAMQWLYAQLRKHRLEIVRTGQSFDAFKRQRGQDWPLNAETMIGTDRLEHFGDLIECHVHHDVVECGVWRGGAIIYAAKVIQSYNSKGTVYGFDSFDGLPEGGHYEQDIGDKHHTWQEFAVSMDTVEANLDRYGVPAHSCDLIQGWFRDTLPKWASNYNGPGIGVLRIDGDMYEGTMDPLKYLYDLVIPGGTVIVDDYGDVRNCRQAVHDFLESRPKSASPIRIKMLDHTCAYWEVPDAVPEREAT